MSTQNLGWYLRRARRMSASELGGRVVDVARQRRWSKLQVLPGDSMPAPPQHICRFDATLPKPALDLVPAETVAGILTAADDVLRGEWKFLGLTHAFQEEEDWFQDPVTGTRAPQSEYCFRVNHRDQAVTGNVKQVWERSRLQHVTVLAAAYALCGDDLYADAAAQQLRSWWAQNPFLSGVNWTSGIELGLRLISWVWTRRLLAGWAGAPELFELNDSAKVQVWWHQRYLAAFRSRGTSANNHVIAEAAGQLVASLAFPWFEESTVWASEASDLLERELSNNTFPSGVNREMAFEYHGFVAELGLVAAVEADRSGQPLAESTWRLLAAMLDVIAATVDERLNAPKYGDADDGRGFVLGPPDANRWASLLSIGGMIVGAPVWWPEVPTDAAASLVASLANRRVFADRPDRRPEEFRDAGITLLRTPAGERPEIWCRCDAGPHGFLSIAAHGHDDALAVEVRHGGTEVLIDPGTYCYHGEEKWRSYFRSTIGHNCVEIGGRQQSLSGGPFLWARQTSAKLMERTVDDDGLIVSWSARHDGYHDLDPPAQHSRTVRLLRGSRRLEIVDRVETAGPQPVRIAFHLGPEVEGEIHDDAVHLSWPHASGFATARLELSAGLTWTRWRGSTDPMLGWYSGSFGSKEPSITIVGTGDCDELAQFVTALQFDS